jgi:hypothetical protein
MSKKKEETIDLVSDEVAMKTPEEMKEYICDGIENLRNRLDIATRLWPELKKNTSVDIKFLMFVGAIVPLYIEGEKQLGEGIKELICLAYLLGQDSTLLSIPARFKL